MIDLLLSTQDAIIAALKAAIPESQAAVRQYVKEGTQPPLVIVGDMDSENIGGKEDICDRITVDVQTVYRGTERRGLLTIMAAVRAALDNQEIAADGVHFSTPRFLSAGTATGEDGVTFAGIQQFEILAEPA